MSADTPHLPLPDRSDLPLRVTVDNLGHRGEGIAGAGGTRLFIPYALPGDTVSVLRHGERGDLVGLLAASPDRIAPVCPYFTVCGGCAVQAWAEPAYAAWKRNLLVEQLARGGVAVPVAELVDAHGEGRRRATFHARVGADGRTLVGYMRARSHDIVPIANCPILAPGLAGALPAAEALALALASAGKPLDLLCTATPEGLDIDLRGHGPLADDERQRLVALAVGHDLARLSNHGVVVLERRKPALAVGAALVELPPGAFLQATAAGESALAGRVTAALRGAGRIADLFSGIGTFALRLAGTAEVEAIDSDAPALAAIDRAARAASGLRRVKVQARDLHRRPLLADELARFDAVCLDPPRAGAEAQTRELAASPVTTVVSIACDPASFARDAAILLGAGFRCDDVVPVDQFRYAAHLEMVAVFRRARPKRARRLLG